LALSGTELERACAATIRVKLLKIGAAIVRTTRRIRLLLASHHPLRDTFLIAARALSIANFDCIPGMLNNLGERGTSAARRKIARGQCQCIAATIKLPTATHFRA